MAENMDRVNESQKSVADAFAELTRLLKNIDELKNQAKAIWKTIENNISDLNNLGK